VNTIYKLQEHRNWVPLTLFGIVIIIGLLLLKFTALQYLLIILFGASTSVMFRLQLISREKYLRRISELSRLAYHDELTGLLNRRKIICELENVRNRNISAQILLMDLDGFKEVNDNHGHLVGDEIIRQAAVRLKSVLNSCKVARLGGDEFLVVCAGCCDLVTTIRLIKRSISEPYMVEGTIINIGVSIGATDFSDASQSVSDMLKQADKAMYRDKTRNRIKSPRVNIQPANNTDNSVLALQAV